MATDFVYLTVRQPAKSTVGLDPTTAQVSDTPETLKTGILQAPGVLPVKRTLGAPASTTFFAFTTASTDISLYGQLAASGLRSNAVLSDVMTIGAGTPMLPVYTAYRKYVTEPGAMNKVFANGVSTTFAVTAHKGAGHVASDIYLETKIFHRAADGTETLILELEDLLSTVSTQYSTSVSLVRKWDTNERLVVYYRHRDSGTEI